MIKSKKKAFIGIIVLILILFFLFLLIKPYLYLFGDLDKLKLFILDFGVYAPLVLILFTNPSGFSSSHSWSIDGFG